MQQHLIEQVERCVRAACEGAVDQLTALLPVAERVKVFVFSFVLHYYYYCI